MNQRSMQMAGEDAAAGFLRGRGFKIIARNWSTKMGELDIVARDGADLVFVEVKARRTDAFLAPELSVDYRKQLKLRKTAEAFLNTSDGRTTNTGSPTQCRFDIIAVVTGKEPLKIRHIRNAF